MQPLAQAEGLPAACPSSPPDLPASWPTPTSCFVHCRRSIIEPEDRRSSSAGQAEKVWVRHGVAHAPRAAPRYSYPLQKHHAAGVRRAAGFRASGRLARRSRRPDGLFREQLPSVCSRCGLECKSARPPEGFSDAGGCTPVSSRFQVSQPLRRPADRSLCCAVRCPLVLPFSDCRTSTAVKPRSFMIWRST